MAGDCISVKFEDGTQWEYCWDDVTPYSDWNYTDVSTGLRASTGEGARAWRTCQYFLKGMPPVCAWFKKGEGEGAGYSCSYEFAHIR